jgi:crossover junction endodeoxyribonuclease RuvC
VSIHEYAPRKIKMAITGKGTASKEQVAKMLFSIMKIDEIIPKHLDATDGLAAAVCHALQNEISASGTGISTTLNDRATSQNLKSKIQNQKSKKYSGWETFIVQNEKRILK